MLMFVCLDGLDGWCGSVRDLTVWEGAGNVLLKSEVWFWLGVKLKEVVAKGDGLRILDEGIGICVWIVVVWWEVWS